MYHVVKFPIYKLFLFSSPQTTTRFWKRKNCSVPNKCLEKPGTGRALWSFPEKPREGNLISFGWWECQGKLMPGRRGRQLLWGRAVQPCHVPLWWQQAVRGSRSVWQTWVHDKGLQRVLLQWEGRSAKWGRTGEEDRKFRQTGEPRRERPCKQQRTPRL